MSRGYCPSCGRQEADDISLFGGSLQPPGSCGAWICDNFKAECDSATILSLRERVGDLETSIRELEQK